VTDLRKDVGLVLAGAVLGGVVSEATDVVTGKNSSVVVLAASIVILGWLTVLSVRLMGPLHLIFRGNAGVNISGEWHGRFTYTKNDADVVVEEVVTIRQRGRYVTGTSKSTAITGNFPLTSTVYSFAANLRADAVLDGTWRNTGHRFHGSFQAKVRRNGKLILGTWIGVDDDGVNRGEFEWRR
jgi:hypothetical protein